MGIVLARLLPPDTFGLIGLAYIVLGFGNVFVNLGMGPALIQRQTLTNRHLRVAFTLSLSMAVVLAFILAAAAPLCGALLRDPRVVPVLRVLAFGFVISGLGIVSNALLLRELAFRKLFYVGLLSMGVQAVVAVSLALTGHGVWSLVWAALLQQAVQTAASYAWAPYSLGVLLSRKETGELAGFGAGISLSSVCNYVALQGDYFVVGRLLGTAPLGIYTRVYSLMSIPTTQVAQALGGVLFPAASRLQDDPQRLRRAFEYSLSAIGFFTLPTMTLIVVVAPELIVGVYGPVWAPAIVPLQILGGFGAFRSLYSTVANFVRAKGWVYRILACQIVYGTSVVLGSSVGALSAGLEGVAVGVGLAILVMWSVMGYYGCRATGVSLTAFVRTLQPGLVMSGVCLVACSVTRASLLAARAPALVVFGGASAVAALACVGAAVLLPRQALLDLPRRLLRSAESALPQRMHGPLRLLTRWGRFEG